MKNTYKIVASLIGVTLLVALMVVFLFLAFRHIEEASTGRKQTHLILNVADDLLSSLTDAETGQRGYLLTDDSRFLEPYLAVRDGIKDQLKNCIN